MWSDAAREAALEARRMHAKIKEYKPAEINRHIDRLDKAFTKHNDRMIAAGRGQWNFEQQMKHLKDNPTDALGRERAFLGEQQQIMREESQRRWGPGMYRAPTGR